MKRPNFVAIWLSALVLIIGCRGQSSNAVIPLVGSVARSDGGSSCHALGSGDLITVCVRIPQSGVAATVTDTLYGSALVGTQACPSSGSAYLCSVGFQAPAGTINQIQIDTSGKGENSSGAFPIEAGAKPVTAVLKGVISSIAVLPFHSTTTTNGSSSSLPLGQRENVWIVAKDKLGQVIIGHYDPPIVIRASGRLQYRPKSLKSSGAAEHLVIFWTTKDFSGKGSSYHAQLHAYESPGPKATPASVEATSGVVYFHVPGTDGSFGPGPVAFSPDHHYLYIAANDDSYLGCPAPGQCKTVIEQFDLASQRFTNTVSLAGVPGVSQLYVTSDGALWIATFQPAAFWSYPLPALHISGGSLGSPETLPTKEFGEPSGFVADESGNLWISSCKGGGHTGNCKQNHGGTPIIVETSIKGSQKVTATVTLPRSCMSFGYFGFSVGDVAFYDGDLYVLGVNDGSAPPARGALWRVSPKTHGSRCPRVPQNFNPGPYFSPVSNSNGKPILVFGVGNNANFRWFPNHGFYILSATGTGKDKIVWDNGPGVTANHVSAAPAPSASPGVLYYASSGKLDLRFSGLGTYEPSANPTASPGSQWSIFPSASFSGDESDNGVAADAYGAWYTANGVCGSWKGVCLAHAIYQPTWGALPGLDLGTIDAGNSSGFGAIINPLNAHGGPFFAQTTPESVCSSQPVSDLTFAVNGLSSGACQITIQQKKGKRVISSQALVVEVR